MSRRVQVPPLPTARWLETLAVALDPCPPMPESPLAWRATETLVRARGSPRDFVIDGDVLSVHVAGVQVIRWARMPWGPRIVEHPLGWDLRLTGVPLRAVVAWTKPGARSGSDPFVLDRERGWVPL